MDERDWEIVSDEADSIISALEDAGVRFCEVKYFKACLEITDKIIPLVKAWKREAQAALRLGELTEEEAELGAEEEVLEE